MIPRSILIAVLAVAGMIFVAMSFSERNPDTTSLSIILTICSAALSWVIADYFNGQQNSARIDVVGERSSEKILNQSKQLWEIEQFVKSKARELEGESGADHLGAITEMISLVRSSNNTYIGDWEGVVSDSVQRKLRSRNEEQNKLFKKLVSESSQDDGSEEKSDLPSYLTPHRQGATGVKRITVLGQEPRSNNTKTSQGILRVHLNEPAYAFNFTGKLYPALESVPEDLRARLVERPEKAPEKISVYVATGTTHDFHVHAKSNEKNIVLPRGEYGFQYIVQTVDTNADQYNEVKQEGSAGIADKPIEAEAKNCA